MTYKPRNFWLADLDEYIKEWRQYVEEHPKSTRAIDVVDALQQFRLKIFGEILPFKDGTFKVSQDNGKSYSHYLTASEAIALHKSAPTGSAAGGMMARKPTDEELKSVKEKWAIALACDVEDFDIEYEIDYKKDSVNMEIVFRADFKPPAPER